MNGQAVLKIEVPIACFRQSRAREYAETYPVPPPSTVYGMLLSMVGETDRFKHRGTKLALAMLGEPVRSTVIRTFRRLKRKELLDPSNARPDYQELLTGIRFLVWVERGDDQSVPPLVERLQTAFDDLASVSRFGGLSLGESRDLVDSVELLSEIPSGEFDWVLQDEDGLLALPIWVDHVGSRGTLWRRFSIESLPQQTPPDAAWTRIVSPSEN